MRATDPTVDPTRADTRRLGWTVRAPHPSARAASIAPTAARCMVSVTWE